jgi:hypothetical protein
MEREIRKIFRGMAEFRDYDVRKCIDSAESLRVKYDGDYMIFSPEELVSKRIAKSKLIKSTNGKDDFYLYGYAWEPVQINY